MIKKMINKVLKKESKCHEKLSIALIVRDSIELEKYFKLFKFILRDRLEMACMSRYSSYLTTDELHIQIRRSTDCRGVKAAYVLNLTRSTDLDEFILYSIEKPDLKYLLKDPKWIELY